MNRRAGAPEDHPDSRVRQTSSSRDLALDNLEH
jgi:hypothetical protein